MEGDYEYHLRKRPFHEAVRRALGLPDETSDEEVTATIAVMRLELSVLRRKLSGGAG